MHVWYVKCSVCDREWREESAVAPVHHPGIHGGPAPEHKVVVGRTEKNLPCRGAGKPRIVLNI